MSNDDLVKRLLADAEWHERPALRPMNYPVESKHTAGLLREAADALSAPAGERERVIEDAGGLGFTCVEELEMWMQGVTRKQLETLIANLYILDQHRQLTALSHPAPDNGVMVPVEYASVESSFTYSDGLHTPTVTVSFPAGKDCNELWEARDRFRAALMQSAKQRGALGGDGGGG